MILFILLVISCFVGNILVGSLFKVQSNEYSLVKPISVPLTYRSDIVIQASDGEKARIEGEKRLAEEARIRAEEEERQRQLAIQQRSSSATISREEVANELRSYGLSEDVVQNFLVIIQRESSFNASAKNPYTSASGLYQFLTESFYGIGCTGSPFNFKDATACAVKAYNINGFNPWRL